MNFNHLAVFLAVAQRRSYTKAAEQLAVDKGHVSRVVQALEASLGVVLVTRTTRTVTLTPAGEALCQQIAAPFASLEASAAGLADRPVTPSGLVTVTTTPDLGRTVLAPLLVRFRARFPAVQVRLRLESDVVALADTRTDLALRVGKVRKGQVKVRRLGTLGAGFFAAPRYLSARGQPRHLGELAGHDGLWPAPQGSRQSFKAGAPPPRPAIECDDFGALLGMALAGGGIAVLPLFLAARDVEAGSLVRVVPEVSLPLAPLSLVTLPERPLAPRVAALRDWLIEQVPLALQT